jgi:hypothetical protein
MCKISEGFIHIEVFLKRQGMGGWVWWLLPIIPDTWEAEIRRMVVQGQPQQKNLQDTVSKNKLDVVTHSPPTLWEAWVGRLD